MLREISILTRLNLCNLYGFNIFKNTKDKSEKRKILSVMLTMTLVVCLVAFYVGMMVYGYVSIGMANVVPAYLVMIASIIILFFGIFKGGEIIFEKKNYEMLCALPVSAKSIVISRFMRMYVENLIFALVVMVPGIVVYGVLIKKSLVFFITGIGISIILPMAPMSLAVIIGTTVTAMTSKMKYKSIAETALLIVFVVGIMAFSGKAATIDESMMNQIMLNLSVVVLGLIEKIYPPAIWFGDFMLGKGFFKTIVYVFGTVVVLMAVMSIVAKNFETVYQNLNSSKSKHNYQIKKQVQSKPIKALYKREFKRYFSSNIYVTNTIIGPIMATMMAGALFLVDLDDVLDAFPVDLDLVKLMPVVFSMIFCMMTTTSVSISLEGKEWWIVKSLPLTTKGILDGKLAMNLILASPFYIISEIFMIAALKPEGIDLIWIVLMPALMICFAGILGLFVNLHFPSFNWENEAAVVKQSISSMIGGLACPVLAIIFAATIILVPSKHVYITETVIILLLSSISVVLYKRNNGIKLEML